jgi:hypothetical protein
VTRRRVARERERWLSAVLIVTAIAGASAVVRFWPVALRQQGPRPLPSRALVIIDSPALPGPGRLLLHDRKSAEPAVSFAVPAATADAVVAAVMSGPPPEVPAEPREVAAVLPAARPLLESRRLDLPLDQPSLPPRREPVIAFAVDEPHALMELPAVAVTRVVTVAGRGILTGVRATTAVFRAAF